MQMATVMIKKRKKKQQTAAQLLHAKAAREVVKAALLLHQLPEDVSVSLLCTQSKTPFSTIITPLSPVRELLIP